jgi:hypothetical protein
MAEMLTRLRYALVGLDSSSASTPSALALHALAEELPHIPAADLHFCRRLGEGAFAYVDLYYLTKNAPTSLDLYYLSETNRASLQSGTTSTSTSSRRRFSIPSLFRKPRDEAVPPGSRLVVVKHAKTSTTLALRDVAPLSHDNVVAHAWA